ncbi:MAG TPA: hypothetical protein VN132_12070 [Bdellovibrio sp.]|nr:hypothetical protein [Bdellovibrio sp.]
MSCSWKTILMNAKTFFNQSRLFNLKNQKGFTAVEVVAATAISVAVVFGTSSIFVDSNKVESSQARQFWIAARRLEMQGLIRSTKTWPDVVALNSSMGCLNAAGTTPVSCAAVSTAQQPIKLPLGSPNIDGASPTLGMTDRGDFCNTFDKDTGNSACPVGIKLSWIPLCDDASCLHAQPKITVKFQVKEKDKPLVDLTSYDLYVFKDPNLESLNDVCTAMGGTLNTSTSTCTIPALSSQCNTAAGLFPTGFDSMGGVQCGHPSPGNCASGYVATGFKTNGDIQCVTACP